MHGENCNQQDDDHGRGGEGHKSPAEDEQSAYQLDNDCRPAEKKCEWHAHRVQDRNEAVRSTSELGVAVLKKSVADHESKWQREKTGRRGKRSEGKPAKRGSKR